MKTEDWIDAHFAKKAEIETRWEKVKGLRNNAQFIAAADALAPEAKDYACFDYAEEVQRRILLALTAVLQK